MAANNTVGNHYNRGINHQYNWSNRLTTIYPAQPEYSATCTTNIDYDTLPPGFPMRKTTLGQNTLKQQYMGALYYPPQRMSIPDDSLYGMDTGTERAHGIRMSYGTMLYPYRHRSPKEVREYSAQIAPMPNLFEWTSYPVSYPGDH